MLTKTLFEWILIFKNKYIDDDISILVIEAGMILIPASVMNLLLYIVWIVVCGENPDSHRHAVPEEEGCLLMAFLDTCWLFAGTPLKCINW